MNPDLIVANRIISVVNQAIAADPDAMSGLLSLRRPCNEKLADHETIQVRCDQCDGGQFSISPLGLLCGIAGVHSDAFCSLIEAVFAVECIRHGTLTGMKVGDHCPVDGCDYQVVLGDLEKMQLSESPGDKRRKRAKESTESP